MILSPSPFLLTLLAGFTLANVEKTIFIAPPASAAIPSPQLNFDDIQLETLSPADPSMRTHIPASFANEGYPRGTESWVYLDGLRPGQRYEVRICWLATQPTIFHLTTHTLASILDSPHLISSLATSTPLLPHHDPLISPASSSSSQKTLLAENPNIPTSALFLQISAAAEYFTPNATLMAHVPPVHADVILDPFLLNVFPRSLVPIAGYVACVAVVGWVVSWAVWEVLAGVVSGEEKRKRRKEKKDI
ncbi:hypothetical protein AJ80_02771 [Polytolypa hystricis UAMH7299]|uniref:Protein PBN1 n=1 Tax=Polytolypa hystricis (strain UAMH7299) TaxID=1447883 RepID=A0A2B7YPM5_POLH7|nr:hypothetical protein AJ80_02771 [Polytolypa hystricis UAMH7299]